MELPGVKPDDVDVTAENGVLTIRGEKQSSATESGDGRYHVIERSYGAFTRSFQLPTGADEQRIDAELADGLLMVRVPKAALAQPRCIEIRNSGGPPAIQGTPTRAGARPSPSKEKPVEAGSAEPAGARPTTNSRANR